LVDDSPPDEDDGREELEAAWPSSNALPTEVGGGVMLGEAVLGGVDTVELASADILFVLHDRRKDEGDERKM
jgi:hypothetical protein